MNDVTHTLSGEEQAAAFELLYKATKTWEPEFIPPPKDTWMDGMIWRMASEPEEIKGTYSEFIGKMRQLYDEMREAILDGVKYRGHDKTYDVHGWRVEPFLDMDYTSNLINPGLCSLRVQLFLTKKNHDNN